MRSTLTKHRKGRAPVRHDIGDNRTATVAEIAGIVGVTEAGIHYRIKQGLTGKALLGRSQRRKP